MTSAIFLAASQASITAPRTALVNCIKAAETSAKAEKVPLEAYPDRLKAACGAQGDRLKAALTAFDVKNGVPRSRASTDAAADVADAFASAASTYKWQTTSQAAADAN
jgi:hypothetical protein